MHGRVHPWPTDMLQDLWRNLETPAAGDAPGAVAADDLVALEFSGPDAVSFLQGYLTCDTTTLTDAEPRGAALCSLKGRVVTFGWCLRSAAGVVYLVHRSLEDVLAGFMKPYLAFSKTRLVPLPDDHLIVIGADPARDGNVAPGVMVSLVSSEEQLRTLRDTWGPSSRRYVDHALIDAGVPWLTADTSGEFLPQMLNLAALGAVSFDKGCYLGQEVVARAQHRGQVKRHLQALRVHDGAELPAPGLTLSDPEGKPAGVVIQSAAGFGSTPARCLAVLQDGSDGPFRAGASELVRDDGPR